MPLGRFELESLLIQALNFGPDSFAVLSSSGVKPLRVASASSSGAVDVFNIYAWNVTHGGASRSSDEFRIQITGAVPTAFAGEHTLIVGWSEEFEVFAAWDPVAHLNRSSTSPSLQIHRETLEAGFDRGLAAETRGSGDVAVAFRAELFAAYAKAATTMHSENPITLTSELNEIPTNVASVPSARTRTARVVEGYFREWDFSRRILDAYDHTCAICGLQLGLIEAAHIIPVAALGSTDETCNGIALCRIHHRAYDSLLIDIAPDLTVRVSKSRISMHRSLGRSAGEVEVSRLEGQPLAVVPYAVGDRPSPRYLAQASIARCWEP